MQLVVKKVSEECENKSKQITELHEKLKHLKESSLSNEADRQVYTRVLDMSAKVGACPVIYFPFYKSSIDIQ